MTLARVENEQKKVDRNVEEPDDSAGYRERRDLPEDRTLLAAIHAHRLPEGTSDRTQLHTRATEARGREHRPETRERGEGQHRDDRWRAVDIEEERRHVQHSASSRDKDR